MNIERRLETIEKAVMPAEVPEKDQLQIIIGKSVDGRFVPHNPMDTMKNREKALQRMYGTSAGVLFINLIDKFNLAETEV